MKKQLFCVLIVMGAARCATAQSTGQVQVGGRLGLPLGVTGRYWFTEHSGGEGILGIYNRTVSLTALYEYHFDLSALTVNGFGWYLGGGAHAGGREIHSKAQFIGGLDAIAGADYNFEAMPLNLSLDWKPAVHFQHSAELAQFAISVRYTFGYNN
ncbi:hypothetical protein GA0116948_10780 [Chitinophaga costaii]|uniref:Outer membrane protein beta-barrel domain-containing protein n=1 Tax=Chitinophaga costaii TaxID=1335309 RepID=A0A1C4E499_9BACT|nr:hypothetical protein [Chitinophaga costaii]PUZ24331.1 hypothetical protein DCM91_12940 [Chitinophaga costaii]SCC38443.1 hypothetical protein GA0116948_10780 [Chitinophaga costaii]